MIVEKHWRERTRDKVRDREAGDAVKAYPSISYATECRVPIYAFDKLDGSNVRAEWTRKKGWYKFGTRSRLVSASDPVFGAVPQLVVDKFGEKLTAVLSAQRYDRAMCFFEFYGLSSFAGMHEPDEEKTLTLIDVAPFKHGILEPEEFLRLFGHLDVPKVLYVGELTKELVEQVRSSTLPNMTFEGIVCKGKNDKKTKIVQNLIGGKLVRINVNTPACCDPSTETYWSM